MSKNIIILLIIVGTALQNGCTRGCIDCDETSKCSVCFGRYLNPTTHQCEAEKAPKEEHCKVYNQVSCSLCEDGYTNDSASKKCVPGSIEGCYIAFTYNKNDLCAACNGKIPDGTMKKCIDFPERETFKNCQIGLRLGGDIEDAECIKCVDGYVIDAQDAHNKKCVTQYEAQVGEGCVGFKEKGICAQCDFEKGYYMPVMGRCALDIRHFFKIFNFD